MSSTVSPRFKEAIRHLCQKNYPTRDPSSFPGSFRLTRYADSAYGDGLNTPSGADRPNPRAISNAVFAQAPGTNIPNPKRATDMFWLWGQYLDHDITLSKESSEEFNITIPTGDEFFDPESTGNVEMHFVRSQFDETTGTGETPREQLGFITSFIDASNVYGSTEARSNWLRTFKDGKLKVSPDDMPPLNDGTMDNAGTTGKNPYVVGDIRGNETTLLLSMHTLWVREHNWWCDRIKAVGRNLTDEQIYQKARVMVESEVQAITFREFLPLLLGKNAIPVYTGYDSEIDTTIRNEFSTAAFRLGHSLVSEVLLRLEPSNPNVSIQEGNLQLRDAFFAPHRFANEPSVDPLLYGASQQICQKLDAKIVNNLRNFLFGAPGSGGFDLAALNIQRGRDHGIPDYNTVRVALGLDAKASFAEITSDTAVAAALSDVYGGDISKVDLWVGGLAEDPVGGGQLGETFRTIVLDQFLRLRDGDPLWYQNRLTDVQIDIIHQCRLSVVIKRNTLLRNILPYTMERRN